MNKKFMIVLVLIVVVSGGYFVLKNGKAPSKQTPITETPTTNKSPVIGEHIVNYTDAGYSPSTINIKLGETVTWKNNSSYGMWTASGAHPSHTVYSGTSLQQHCPDTAGTAFDTCTSILPGGSWSFTFNKIGSWKYHNHVKPGDWGTVVVE